MFKQCIGTNSYSNTFRLMNKFTIKDIENLSGIKAHTLRIWEQRYQIIVPKRKDSNHRYYDAEDLKHILRVAFLYKKGVKISQIAKLKIEDLKSLTLIDAIEDNSDKKLIANLLEHTLDFDEVGFESVLDTALAKYDFGKCIIQIIYPFLVQIGAMWLNETALPAQEHFSTNIIRRKIITAIDKLGVRNQNTGAAEKYLLFTPEGELHEMPLLMMHYMLKSRNVQLLYIGSNVKIEDIATIIDRHHVTHLYFHIITNFAANSVDEYVFTLAKTFKHQKLVFSGPLTERVTVKLPNLFLLDSLEKTIEFAQEGGKF
jgi:MerR family transcriptional regulator, light-induced transcriptional regulator